MNLNLPDILKPEDIMDALYIGRNTVYDLLKTGEISGFRIGRSWRVTREALEEYIITSAQK